MKIAKEDALKWFVLFDELQQEGQELGVHQMEIVLSTLSQIEARVEADHAVLMQNIPHLRSLGGRTFYVGPDDHFPKGCRGCLTGTGLTAIRKTNCCNLACPFCYNFGEMDQQEPIGEGFWEIGGGRYRVEDMDLLFSIQGCPGSVCYVYMEPFMEIEVYYPMIRKFHEAGVHQHMYTNGLLANEKNLRELRDAGLDELRFNLGASNCNKTVIENMSIASSLFPFVGIETPMTREFYAQFRANKTIIMDSGISFMNCAELHLNANNLWNYEGENFYMSRLGYLSPVFSRNLTLTLMAEADKEQWPIAVHDCSNHTKFARDLHLRAREGGWFGSTTYGREFNEIPYCAFLPILSDPAFTFLEEEPLPVGYRYEDIVL
mgnify:CR=1 FL=1